MLLLLVRRVIPYPIGCVFVLAIMEHLIPYSFLFTMSGCLTYLSVGVVGMGDNLDNPHDWTCCLNRIVNYAETLIIKSGEAVFQNEEGDSSFA